MASPQGLVAFRDRDEETHYVWSGSRDRQTSSSHNMVYPAASKVSRNSPGSRRRLGLNGGARFSSLPRGPAVAGRATDMQPRKGEWHRSGGPLE